MTVAGRRRRTSGHHGTLGHMHFLLGAPHPSGHSGPRRRLGRSCFDVLPRGDSGRIVRLRGFLTWSWEALVRTSMKRLILIPCSHSKRGGGSAKWDPTVTAPRRLGPAAEDLWAARREMAQVIGEPPAPDLGGDGPLPPLLPAVQRYSGKLYDGAQILAWEDAAREQLAAEALIVSGLYGLVTPQEPIRRYDCWMGRTVEGQRVNRWWRRRGLGAWLRAYVESGRVTDVWSFLSSSYVESIGGLRFEGVHVHWTPYGRGNEAIRAQGRLLHLLVVGGRCTCADCSSLI